MPGRKKRYNRSFLEEPTHTRAKKHTHTRTRTHVYTVTKYISQRTLSVNPHTQDFEVMENVLVRLLLLLRFLPVISNATLDVPCRGRFQSRH